MYGKLDQLALWYLPVPVSFYSCHINCLSKIAVTSNLQLVPALSNNGKATFKWHLQKKVGTNYGSYIDLDPITETGVLHIHLIT